MTAETTDADLVEMLRAMLPQLPSALLRRRAIQLVNGACYPVYGVEFRRLLTWANARRYAAVEIERQCSVEVIATRDAQIDGLTEALEWVDRNASRTGLEIQQHVRAALEPAAEGGV